jgi:outer membrane protein assembly factor BamB
MRRVLVRLLIVMAVLAPAAISALPAEAATAAISLQPTVGPPTTHVQVAGGNFAPNETVKIFFDNTLVATTTANSAGQIITSFNVPASAQPGFHTVKAVGQTSGKTATAQFLVRVNWPQFRFSWPHWGVQPFENTITPANVSTLTTAFTGDADAILDYSSPSVANSVVYIGGEDGKLYAFRAGTGALLWTAPTGGDIIYASPAIDSGIVYVGSTDDKLYAFNAGTGALLWTGSTGNDIYSSASVVNGVVYVGSNDEKLYAFKAAGCGSATCSPLWTGNTGGPVASSPAVSNGKVFVGNSDGNLFAFNANGCGSPTCPPLWTSDYYVGISASPSVANNVVYIHTLDGFLHALKPSDGSQLWKAAVPAGSIFNSSTAVASGVVYVGGSDSKLYAFSAAGTTNCSGTSPNKTCLPLWTGTSSGPLQASPAVANGVVYISSTDHKVYGFRATGCGGATCAPLWTTTTLSGNNDYPVFSSPAVANGTVFVGSGSGNPNPGKLYAFRLP